MFRDGTEGGSRIALARIYSLLKAGERWHLYVCGRAGWRCIAEPELPERTVVFGADFASGQEPIARDSGRVSGKRPAAPAATASDRSCSVVAEIVPPPHPSFADLYRRLSQAGNRKS